MVSLATLLCRIHSPKISATNSNIAKDNGETYRTATGNMETTSLAVKLTNVRLPHLSRNRIFTATSYGVIMGIGMMDKLRIDQSWTEKIITWDPLFKFQWFQSITGLMHTCKLSAKAWNQKQLFRKTKERSRRRRQTKILPHKAAPTSFWPLTNQQKRVSKRLSMTTSSRLQGAMEPNWLHNNKPSYSMYSSKTSKYSVEEVATTTDNLLVKNKARRNPISSKTIPNSTKK